MTLRILVDENAGVRSIQLDGRLTGEEICALENEIGASFGAVCLELENLGSADAAGLSALRRLREAGVAMRGVPPHLAWRIEADES